MQFRRETRLDIALVKNPPIAQIFLPAADIPTFVGEGRVDIGITGRDQVAEHDAQLPAGQASSVEEVMDLGFGGCKLQVQAPVKSDFASAKDLVGRNVVTSFTALARQFFVQLEGKEDISTNIKYVGGSVEAACALGVADGIVDLVGMFVFLGYYPHCQTGTDDIESGETMKAAGLQAIDTVVESTAVLVKSKNTTNSLVDLITPRIRGVISTSLSLIPLPHLQIMSANMNSCPKIRPLPVQHPPFRTGHSIQHHPGQARSHHHRPRRSRLGGC